MTHGKKWACAIGVWAWHFAGPTVSAQTEPITFDRPGVADSPFLVVSGGPQIEMGVASGFQAFNPDDFWPVVLLRYRVHDEAELRVNANYKPPLTVLTDRLAAEGIVLWSAGGKVNVCSEKGLRPQTAVIANGFIGTPGAAQDRTGWGLDFYLAFIHTVHPKVSVNTNVGYLRFNLLGAPSLGASCAVNAVVTERLGCFVEGFGWQSTTGNSPEVGWDIGATLLSGEFVQWDVSFVRSYPAGARVDAGSVGVSRFFN